MANEHKDTTENSQSEILAAAVTAAMTAIAPVLKEIALTPDKIRELKAPYKDPALEAREKRESAKEAADTRRNIDERKQRQEQCPHGHGSFDGSGYKEAITIEYDFWNRPQGRCNMCEKLIQPAHWDFYGNGEKYMIPEDREYQRVIRLASTQVAGY